MKHLIALLGLSLSGFVLTNPALNPLGALAPPVPRSQKELGVPSTRPKIDIGPKTPRLQPYSSPSRNTICTVQSNNDSITDDSAFILDALDACNNGGHVIFSADTTYLIGTALNLTFLSSIDIGLSPLLPNLPPNTIPLSNHTNHPKKSLAPSYSHPTQPTGKPTPSRKSSKM